ncbi:MAG: glycosyltransferase family 2 protein [Planctomycetota bacterium]|nr:glycosyltransferase family 2 protein [Planctomycetota bacterium]
MFLELLHLVLVSLISFFGIHRLLLLVEARFAAPSPHTDQIRDPDGVTRVLIQIPVYRDCEVALRCIRSIDQLDWPVDQLQIQVLDDSDDGSEKTIARGVEEAARKGLDIVHIHRSDRSGFKAGALAAGLLRSEAQLVAIFDADFTVPRDFLKSTVHLFEDSRVGMVQTRWGFRNREVSLLTRAQARLLDGHFRIEHRARAAAGRFFNFNGTAGIWRRAAIDDAGGWSGETVVEDMELSLRAWRRGWKFCYLDHVICESDLPDNFGALRTQQRRWVAGGMQVLSRQIHEFGRERIVERLDLLAILGGSLVAPLLVLLTFVSPLLWWQRSNWISSPEYGPFPATTMPAVDLCFFLAATVSIALFYLSTDRARQRSRWLEIWGLMILGLGLALHISRSVFAGLRGQVTVFERTPKDPQATGFRRASGAEKLYLVYLLVVLLSGTLWSGIASIPLVAMMTVGLMWSLADPSHSRVARQTAQESRDELAQFTLDP